MTPLKSGSTIGILGGGQLARMLALAAARLGLKSHIYAPEGDNPAFDVTPYRTIAAYDDEQSLAAFAAAVSTVTLEFENIPVATVEYLTRSVPVRPGAKALACAQDRINEKSLARELGAKTAEFVQIDSLDQLHAGIARIGTPSILKTRRLGYDGKGQAKILSPGNAANAWKSMGGQPAILEAVVPFDQELSIVAARALDGTFKAFDVTENTHRDHILLRSLAPAAIAPETAATALDIARRMADSLDYAGVFAIEFFAVSASGRTDLYVNEMAPRVHNSGHWTLDGADTSQFEQAIRAVAGWPLGSVERRAPQVEMINLIGDGIHEAAKWAAIAGVQVHDYGKSEARPGRKMGHITRLIHATPPR